MSFLHLRFVQFIIIIIISCQFRFACQVEVLLFAKAKELTDKNSVHIKFFTKSTYEDIFALICECLPGYFIAHSVVCMYELQSVCLYQKFIFRQPAVYKRLQCSRSKRRLPRSQGYEYNHTERRRYTSCDPAHQWRVMDLSTHSEVVTSDGDIINITHEPLDSVPLVSAVTLPQCGAVSVFIGIAPHSVIIMSSSMKF